MQTNLEQQVAESAEHRLQPAASAFVATARRIADVARFVQKCRPEWSFEACLAEAERIERDAQPAR